MMHYNHPPYHAVPRGLVDQTFENPLQPEATPGRTLPLGTVLVVIAIVFHGM